MKHLLVAVALFAACRNDRARTRDDTGRDGPASHVSVVPKLPRSPDGAARLQSLNRSIETARDARTRIPRLLERAAIRGRLEDYEQAVRESATLVEQHPDDTAAWKLRLHVLLRVHDFEAARATLATLAPRVHSSELLAHEITLAAATGDLDRVLALHTERARVYPSPSHLTQLAVTLAKAERFDEAIALIPKAAAAVRDNPPFLLAWLLFQWGRIYELDGQIATARAFFAAAHERLPGYLEATSHLAQAMIAINDRESAKTLVIRALEDNRHPELLALAAELGNIELLDEARATWERYVNAFPLAFADHAARFYLGAGRDPKRAFELARINQDNRDTREARALAVEAALASDDPVAACELVDPLVSAGTRSHRLIAWKALSRCGRSSDAETVSRALGIAP